MDSKSPLTLNRLVIAVVQEQDSSVASKVLADMNMHVTRLSSSGGFLSHRSVTLLIGYEAGRDEELVNALEKVCRTRVEYVTIPIEGSVMHMSAPTPITVGGATLFVLDVERYEVV